MAANHQSWSNKRCAALLTLVRHFEGISFLSRALLPYYTSADRAEGSGALRPAFARGTEPQSRSTTFNTSTTHLYCEEQQSAPLHVVATLPRTEHWEFCLHCYGKIMSTARPSQRGHGHAPQKSSGGRKKRPAFNLTCANCRRRKVRFVCSVLTEFYPYMTSRCAATVDSQAA